MKRAPRTGRSAVLFAGSARGRRCLAPRTGCATRPLQEGARRGALSREQRLLAEAGATLERLRTSRPESQAVQSGPLELLCAPGFAVGAEAGVAIVQVAEAGAGYDVERDPLTRIFDELLAEMDPSELADVAGPFAGRGPRRGSRAMLAASRRKN